jgi:hypothetical protein
MTTPDTTTPPVPSDNTHKTAYIIDGVVVMTMLTDERSQAIVLSNPTIVDITNLTFPDEILENGDNKQVVITNGWTYDGTTFHKPE